MGTEIQTNEKSGVLSLWKKRRMDIGRHPAVSATPFYFILFPVLSLTSCEPGQHTSFVLVANYSDN